MTIVADKFEEETTSDGAAGVFEPTSEKTPGVPQHKLEYKTLDTIILYTYTQINE